ncbi:MAG TPA: hypothetical protein VET89_13530 [Stellaceae bacterium]|nr:hypothetical protein [Stellaceae bacterium]
MKRVSSVVLALSFIAAGGPAGAAGPPAVQPSQLIGNTLSAVAYVPHAPGLPGGGELSRIMLQAYLRADGRALVRAWDPARDAYTPPAERRWSLAGSKFCIDLPFKSAAPICADIHIWGPRIAGVGVMPYAMLDGDLQPGNALSANR